MKGDAKIIKQLNDILAGELTAINQYFLHARMCKHWGYNKLAEKIYKESIDEMKHAQVLMDRILFLDGLPNVQKLNPISVGQSVPEQMAADLGVEEEAIPLLKTTIKMCNEVGDHGTRELLEHILVSEEEHYEWLETQISLMKEIGKENYLAQQL